MVRTTINRAVLALIGLVLLGGGLLVAAGGAGVYRGWNLTPPAGWPLSGRHDVLIPGAEQVRWAAQDWWWPAGIAALALLLLLALTWLLGQAARRRRHRALPPSGDPSFAVLVDDHAVSDVIADDLDNLAGVRHARTSLSGPPGRLEARIALTLEPGGDPVPVLDGVAAATERARRSIGQDALPARIDLKLAPHPPHRVD